MLKFIPDVFIQKEFIKNFFAIYYRKIKNKKNNNQIHAVQEDYPFLMLCYYLSRFVKLIDIVLSDKDVFDQQENNVLNDFKINLQLCSIYEEKIKNMKIMDDASTEEEVVEKINNIITWKREKKKQEENSLLDNFNEESWEALKNNKILE